MVKASRRSLVLASALAGFANRAHRSSAQEEEVETPTPDDLFRAVALLARDPAISDEENERILRLAEALGIQRAKLLEQPYSPADLVYGLSLLCKWPFKPEPLSDYQAVLDTRLPEALAFEPDPMVIADRVPSYALTLDLGELFRELEDGSLQPYIEDAFIP